MIKTNKYLIIELRNKIAFRIIEQKANILYFKKIIRQSKTNSPEIVDAFKKKNINEENLFKDEIFLKCIDEMIKGGKY
jgi:hypothetical protein